MKITIDDIEYISADDLVYEYGISSGHLNKLMKDGKIPRNKCIGFSKAWKKDEILEVLRKLNRI